MWLNFKYGHIANVAVSSRLLIISLQPELCSHVFNLTYEYDRIALMQIAINLYRLLVLDGQAPDLLQRAQQGVPEYRSV